MTGRALRRIAPALFVLTLLSLGGCAASRQDTDSPFDSGEGEGRVVLEVQNLNFADARLYAFRDGQRLSLGTVTGKQTGRFPMDWRFGQRLQIEINLLAGPTCTTEYIPVDPGDILELQIPVSFNSMPGCR